MNINILRFDEIGSTNTEALEMARRGAAEGVAVLARRQSAGRGRLGRTWFAETDSAILFSIILRPRFELGRFPLLTLMSAVAVHDALETVAGIDCDIKWVNDVLVGEKKICGILAESTETPAGRAVVVGIGINLRASAFPPELAETATSVESETGVIVSGEGILQKLVGELSSNYAILATPVGDATIRESWTSRSSYAAGKLVRVEIGDDAIEGTTAGISDSGELRVRLHDDTIKTIQTGDVTRLRSI